VVRSPRSLAPSLSRFDRHSGSAHNHLESHALTSENSAFGSDPTQNGKNTDENGGLSQSKFDWEKKAMWRLHEADRKAVHKMNC
jgi:hypothetical protein